MAAVSAVATLLGTFRSVKRQQAFSASDSLNLRHLLGASPDRVTFTRAGAVVASAVGEPFVTSWDATSVTIDFNGGAGAQLLDIFCEVAHSLIK